MRAPSSPKQPHSLLTHILPLFSSTTSTSCASAMKQLLVPVPGGVGARFGGVLSADAAPPPAAPCRPPWHPLLTHHQGDLAGLPPPAAGHHGAHGVVEQGDDFHVVELAGSRARSAPSPGGQPPGWTGPSPSAPQPPPHHLQLVDGCLQQLHHVLALHVAALEALGPGDELSLHRARGRAVDIQPGGVSVPPPGELPRSPCPAPSACS